ncbi:MAG TPA: hypothetical protein VFQ60_01105 [Patescibacteria group bacterium]|nr:hypothetical protein [Patescibacteria group bacterium]
MIKRLLYWLSPLSLAFLLATPMVTQAVSPAYSAVRTADADDLNNNTENGLGTLGQLYLLNSLFNYPSYYGYGYGYGMPYTYPYSGNYPYSNGTNGPSSSIYGNNYMMYPYPYFNGYNSDLGRLYIYSQLFNNQ